VISGLVPVYQPIGASAADRVVGFVNVTLRWPPNCSVATEVTLFGSPQIVPRANATAILADGLPAAVPVEDRAELFSANMMLAAAPFAVLAPVLVR
jgi:hypothetical protein